MNNFETVTPESVIDFLEYRNYFWNRNDGIPAEKLKLFWGQKGDVFEDKYQKELKSFEKERAA